MRNCTSSPVAQSSPPSTTSSSSFSAPIAVGVTPSSQQNHYHLPPYPYAAVSNNSLKWQQLHNLKLQPPPHPLQHQPDAQPQQAQEVHESNCSDSQENHYEFILHRKLPQQPQNQQHPQVSSQTQIVVGPQVPTVVKKRLEPTMCGHRMIAVNPAVPAFLPSSSSSCASSSNASSSSGSSNSNPPSVPTTPESQSSERLSSIARSHPDLSKLEELQLYLSHVNLNHSHENNQNSAGHSHNINAIHSGNSVHNNLYSDSNSSAINPNEEIIYSNSSLFSHHNLSNMSVDNRSSNGLLDTTSLQYSHNNDNNHIRRGSTGSGNFDAETRYGWHPSRVQNTSLPPPSPPKNLSPRSVPPPSPFCNSPYQRQPQQQHRLYHDHEYQNQQNLNELLILENRELKAEIEQLRKRMTSFEKIEQDVQRVYEAHFELIKSAEKKEKLERAVRYKLEIEVKRLQAENEELQGSAAALSDAIVASSTAGGRAGYPPQRTASYDANGRGHSCHP